MSRRGKKPATSFQDLPDDFLDPAWLLARVELYTKFLSGGLFDVDRLLQIRDLLNSALTDGTPAHPQWIAKPQAKSPPTEADTAAYPDTIVARLAPKLAALPCLDYAHATDEDHMALLQLSILQTGIDPADLELASLDDHYEWFEKLAPVPMLRLEDLPKAGQENDERQTGEGLEPLKPTWLREGPYSRYLESLTQARVHEATTRLKNLSASERNEVLKQLGIKDAVEEPKRADKEQAEAQELPPKLQPGVPEETVLATTALTVALETMQEMLLAQQKQSRNLKKRQKDSSSDSDSEEDAEAKLEKICKFGGSQLYKKKKDVVQFHQEVECDKIRNQQGIRKSSSARPNKWELLWNQYLDEETRLLVQLEQIAHHRDVAGISAAGLKECSLYEKAIYTQLGGIQEKMQMTFSCMKAAALGRHDEAEKQMSLYSDEMANKTENKVVLRLAKKAREEVKAEKELSMLEAMTKLAGRSKEPHQQRQDQRDRQQDDRDERGAGRLGKRNRGDGPAGFVMRWVDGSFFDASLAGVKAPDPDCFPGYYKARLDGADKGIMNKPGWRGECGACGRTGHSHSECPANRWSHQGEERVNVRWLYEKGFCDAAGAKA